MIAWQQAIATLFSSKRANGSGLFVEFQNLRIILRIKPDIVPVSLSR
jgi:hypothetical protein